MKIIIYFKFRDSEGDPLDVEYHYWSVEANSCDRALEIAEESPFIPWRDYLVEIIDSDNLDTWMRKNDVKPEDVQAHVFR